MSDNRKGQPASCPIPNCAVYHDATESSSQKPARKGGRASRDKGNRAERAIVRFLQERGFAAERVPLSGSAGGSYLGDLTVPVIGIDRVVEVKCRADGFRELYRWLIDRDILIVRADRSEPLVVLPLKLAAEIAAKAGGL
jgi:Archaeal holliday junction resolvase (hjc)